MICRTLQDFLINIKISDMDMRHFNEGINSVGNCKIKNAVLDMFDSFKDEKKNKSNTALSYAKQKAELWNFIGNQSYEAYSEEFLDKHIDSEFHSHRFFYRGVANKDYKLVSGIYRNNEKEENYYFHELQVRCPNILAHLKNFNKLTYMQHYGSPTRLLDITANPLVGLYFACESHFEIDGKVSIFGIRSDEVAYETSDRVQMLSHLQELSREEQEQLQILSYIYLFKGKFPQSTNSKYSDPEIERFYYNIQKENNAFERGIVPLDMLRPVFVQANQDNPRILKQDGAFIMSALDFNETDSDGKLKKHVIKELIIPEECKKTILSELDTICIHKASLFPELDTVSQYLRNR